MLTTIQTTVRRIDFEPKEDFLGVRGPHTWAHVFLTPRQSPEVDAYTEDLALHVALVSAWRPHVDPDAAPNFPPLVEVEYEEVQGERRLTRVTLDYDFTRLASRLARSNER